MRVHGFRIRAQEFRDRFYNSGFGAWDLGVRLSGRAWAMEVRIVRPVNPKVSLAAVWGLEFRFRVRVLGLLGPPDSSTARLLGLVWLLDLVLSLTQHPKP